MISAFYSLVLLHLSSSPHVIATHNSPAFSAYLVLLYKNHWQWMVSRHKTINITMLDTDVQGMESKGAEVFPATELLQAKTLGFRRLAPGGGTQLGIQVGEAVWSQGSCPKYLFSVVMRKGCTLPFTVFAPSFREDAGTLSVYFVCLALGTLSILIIFKPNLDFSPAFLNQYFKDVPQGFCELGLLVYHQIQWKRAVTH